MKSTIIYTVIILCLGLGLYVGQEDLICGLAVMLPALPLSLMVFYKEETR